MRNWPPGNTDMISRRQEISLQFNQFVDGAVLAASLLLGYGLRRSQIIDFDVLPQVPPLESLYWMFIVVVLFGPLLLEMQGFYQYPLEKTVQRSLRQIAYAGAWLGLIIGACVVFLRLDIPSRSASPAFHPAGATGLLLREAAYRSIYLRRLRKGGHGESIILVGTAAKMDSSLQGCRPRSVWS